MIKKDIINQAFIFALNVHKNQIRKDGKPYISHPFMVATILAKNNADDNLIAAGLLHDVIEDTKVSKEELAKEFNEDIVNLILFDTENKTLSWKERKDATLLNLVNCNTRCAMLVLADKLANIKDIYEGLQKSDDVWKQFKYGKEVQEWLYNEYVLAFENLKDYKMYYEFKTLVEKVFIKKEKKSMEVKVESKNDLTYISISGNINSANVNEFADRVANLNYDNGIIIDALELEYISSAGLRVILSLKKKSGNKTFKIINVNEDVNNIFEVTGFSEIMDVEAAFKEINIDGCVIIGKGACGECYRIDDETIIKLYYGDADLAFIEHEKSLAKKAFVMGIPTAISYDVVKANNRYGVVYEMIKSKTLAELIRQDNEHLDDYIKMYVDICKKVHQIHTHDKDIPSFKEANRDDISRIENISDEERDYLYKFIDLVPEGDTCIHGDLNINNIMVQDNECCLIDMGELSTGTPLFDISRIIFSMVYANPIENEYNDFYKMPTKLVSEIFNKFFYGYFNTNDISEAIKENKDVEYLYPLAWFRCATSMLKGNRWSTYYKGLASSLLRNNLIPFIKEKLAEKGK